MYYLFDSHVDKTKIKTPDWGVIFSLTLKAHLINVTAVSPNIPNLVSLNWFIRAYHH